MALSLLRTLQQVVASKDFAAAAQFKTQVTKIEALKNAEQKAAAYFQLTWIVDLERGSGLSERQAETVASSLQTPLRGGLQ